MGVNTLNLTRNDYKGGTSTLCPGCGHNAIANNIIGTAYELALEPHRVIKMSGIGCSSKSPAYFLGRSHGFNSLHGRMPSVTTGAMLANRDLLAIGVSGDGDSGSIGMGQFKHIIRRNVPMVYIIENNGVYGLTKGQHSATQDEGVKQRYYGVNEYQAVDICMEAIASGASFVARSFAGSPKEVNTLLALALRHKGLAILDIISPCVAFNDTPESTKSYEYVKGHKQAVHHIDYVPSGFVPSKEDIQIDESGFDAEGEQVVTMHDGSSIVLKRVDEHGDYDPTDSFAALQALEKARIERKILTGLIYFEPERRTVHEISNMVDTPLSALPDEKLRPGEEKLAEVLSAYAV